jgi:hypothetical protein
MEAFESIYSWGALCFVVLGLLYAVVGLVSGDCGFVGGRAFSDSFVGRVASGVGIAMVWPVFVPFVLLTLFSKDKPRL